jgi:hypothetical protein
MGDGTSERGQWKENWKTPTWELVMTCPVQGVFCTRVSGHADLDCALHLMRAFDRIAAITLGALDAFHDWEAVTGYESIVRQELARWSEVHEKAGEVHVLVRSRLVAMGVSVANVALGGMIQVYSDRAKFEKIRADRIAQKRRK